MSLMHKCMGLLQGSTGPKQVGLLPAAGRMARRGLDLAVWRKVQESTENQQEERGEPPASLRLTEGRGSARAGSDWSVYPWPAALRNYIANRRLCVCIMRLLTGSKNSLRSSTASDGMCLSAMPYSAAPNAAGPSAHDRPKSTFNTA